MDKQGHFTNAISGRLERLHLKAGQRVFSQGDVGNAAYIVQKGLIRLYQAADDQQVELGDIGVGEIFGEMAVLDQGSRSASAVAIEDSTVAIVPLPVFQHKLKNADRFLAALIGLFIKNIRNSPKLFLRRPRSFRDHVKQMRMFSWNMRRFAGRIQDVEMADDLLDVLDRLDANLVDLNNVSELCADNRHDLLSEDDLTGNGFVDVIGTEGQRKI
ncbi:cyclic nucleotide-binding domain-containing protein [Magnetospirillum moscoviense]|uniref:cyclic nucleotide-binding domain-containing protein n=1 Tax=Magnetospirillum moscoviense TaxID=1437059 RepID=UPI000AE117FF|nr:cyclic nucleotide-binding domain-containing protein [Magnetospirillum moscoviense]